MHKKKRFEDSTIESWPDVLKDIRIESIPTDYIEHIKINFIDGREWIIDVNDNPDADYDAAIEELYQEYSNSIKTINFNINIEKIKKDIEKRTNIFLKKRK